jgi:hypothetical protein
VDNPRSGLVLQTATVAELVRAAGLFLQVDAGESARDHELKLERELLTYNLRVFEAHAARTRPGSRQFYNSKRSVIKHLVAHQPLLIRQCSLILLVGVVGGGMCTRVWSPASIGRPSPSVKGTSRAKCGVHVDIRGVQSD